MPAVGTVYKAAIRVHMNVSTVAIATETCRDSWAAGDLLRGSSTGIPCKRCHRIVQLANNIDEFAIWMEGQMPRATSSLEGNRLVDVLNEGAAAVLFTASDCCCCETQRLGFSSTERHPGILLSRAKRRLERRGNHYESDRTDILSPPRHSTGQVSPAAAPRAPHPGL